MAGDVCCNTCVFKYNELLNNPFPCNCCMKFSEWIPIDEETYNEAWFLDDPKVVMNIIDTIDEITNKIEALDTVLPGFSILEKTRDCIDNLKSIKKTIVKIYADDGVDILYTHRPWYDEPCPPENADVPF